MRLIFSIVSFFLIFKCIKSDVDSQKNLSSYYYRVASLYCYIDDYPAWLEEQSRLHQFLKLAQFLYIDIDRIRQELERYRLQRECLKVLERLPIVFGRG